MKENRKLSDYNSKVCIVGLGPAGIGAALAFSNSNLASRVLCLDAGTSLSIRSCSILQNSSCKREKPCQMISGFGGSSLFGAKISAFPAGSKLATILGSKDLTKRKLSDALDLFNNYLPLQKPNITLNDIKNAKELFDKLGFEYRYYDAYLYAQEELRKAYQKIFSQLNSAGTSLLLNTELIKIHREENDFKLVAMHDNQKITIFTKYLLLGVGRLGRSLLKSVNTKLNLKGNENHLDVGVRLEFPTDLYPDITRYHNDLKLLFNDARTFCVCKDGKIAPYFFEDVFFTDGYYNPMYRSGFTNLGIMIRLKHTKQNDTIFDEIKKKLLNATNDKPICQRLPDYLNISTKSYNPSKSFKSSISFWVYDDVNQYFPQPISTKIKEAVFYFASRVLPKGRWNEVSVFAPEVGYGGLSFPVNSDFSIIPGMYLIGDCAGRFRGILQAFCSGVICAESIIGGENEKNP
jgi:uncharacterized FAD-dependent dehydrogenase